MHPTSVFLAAVSALTLGITPVAASFPLSEVSLHNARKGDAYIAHVGPLARGEAKAKATFQRLDGSSWIQLLPDGTIHGKPGPDAPERSQVRVRATVAGESSPSEAVFTIPVRNEDQKLVDSIRVMTMNLWHGGSKINDYHRKQLSFVLNSGVDIVGFEEAWERNGTRIGEALGWYHWQSSDSVAIVSRYPIVEEHGEINRAGGVRINLDGGRPGSDVNMWTTHLNAFPYGPHDFCYENMTETEVMFREAGPVSKRGPQMLQTLTGMLGQLTLADDTPVLLVGDFNAPSHLDWVEPLQADNCGVKEFKWPSSVLPEEYGLIDSFRELHPDPAKAPGRTWSPVFPRQNGTFGPLEPQDRIDFIHYKGALEVLDSRFVTAGEVKIAPDYADNEWPTDHRAVITHFGLSKGMRKVKRSTRHIGHRHHH